MLQLSKKFNFKKYFLYSIWCLKQFIFRPMNVIFAKTGKITSIINYISRTLLNCFLWFKIVCILKPNFFVISSTMIFLSFFNIVFAETSEAIDLTTFDNSDCVIGDFKVEANQTITMSNGTQFHVRAKSSFDQIFTEINAPGYWSENEYVTDQQVFTMTNYVPQLQPTELIDGNLTAENAHYALRTPAVFMENIDISSVSKLKPEEQATVVVNHLANNIADQLEELAKTIDKKDISVKNVVYDFLTSTMTRPLWLASTEIDLDPRAGVGLHFYITETIRYNLSEGLLSSADQELYTHIATQIFLICVETVKNKPTGFLVNNPLCYAESFTKIIS